MRKERTDYKRSLQDHLFALAHEKNIDASLEEPILEKPPRSDLGDIAFPMFSYAKAFRMSPAAIAAALVERLNGDSELAELGRSEATGPYVNVRLNRTRVIQRVFRSLADEGELFGRSGKLAGRNIVIEFSSPNTNKPLHLGHLRNDALGECVSRLLRACGAEVHTVNLINDRGIHICKSMLAYKTFGEGETPASTGMKPDHFVGKYYVRYDQWAREDSSAEEQARKMLQAWEQGDAEVTELWKTMNDWTIQGLRETYERTNIDFEKFYYESETYKSGRDEVLRGLEEGAFYREDDGSVWVDLEEIGLDKRVLLRKDGTSLYLTQDIGTAIARHRDWSFDSLVYVVASEQNYHFRVLFYVLKKLGYEWADSLYHLSYGMVNLPEGKMKSREGTVVDADDLLDRLSEMASDEIREKEREAAVGDINEVASSVALGALHYYLLQISPAKDMIFSPKESLSFNGNTGPYLQYMGARIASMLRKPGGELRPKLETVTSDILSVPEEWELLTMVSEFPEVIESAADGMNPSLLTTYLYELAKTFSRYYHDHPILTADDEELRAARLELARGIQGVLRKGLELINVPFLEVM